MISLSEIKILKLSMMAGVETFLALVCNYIFIYVSYPSVMYHAGS